MYIRLRLLKNNQLDLASARKMSLTFDIAKKKSN